MDSRFGKAHVEIRVEGCVDCGTLWSSRWVLARTVEVQIGKRRSTIDVHRCADCAKKQSNQKQSGTRAKRKAVWSVPLPTRQIAQAPLFEDSHEPA